jgi:hypothetical protein
MDKLNQENDEKKKEYLDIIRQLELYKRESIEKYDKMAKQLNDQIKEWKLKHAKVTEELNLNKQIANTLKSEMNKTSDLNNSLQDINSKLKDSNNLLIKSFNE